MRCRLGLLHELVPQAAVIAVLLDPNLPDADLELRSVEAASRTIGIRVLVVKAATSPELDTAFATIIQAGAGALQVGKAALFFTSQRQRLAVLSARHGLPSSYPEREYVAAGGLLSYGTRPSRRVSPCRHLRCPDSQGREAWRHAGRAANQVRVGHQSRNCEDARAHGPQLDAVAC